MTVKQIVKKYWRYPICRYYRKKLKVGEFTIISSDCAGGCLYHDLGLRFASPTINLTVPKSLDFFERLDHYLKIEPVADGYSKHGAPVMRLDDIEIIGVHYSSHEELIRKWNERCRRIKWDRIVIMTNSRFVCGEADIARFAKLPYPKVLFTKEIPQNPFEVFAPALNEGADLTAYCDSWGRQYFEKYFDCVRFLKESVE